MKVAAALIGQITLAGCGLISPAGTVVSPVEVRQNIQALDGKVVTVEGWIGRCDATNCGLYASLEDAELVEDWRPKDNGRPSDAWYAAMNRRVSIGGNAWFDFRVQFFAMSKVKVRGRIDSYCRTEGVFCFDRANELEPVQFYPFS